MGLDPSLNFLHRHGLGKRRDATPPTKPLFVDFADIGYALSVLLVVIIEGTCQPEIDSCRNGVQGRMRHIYRDVARCAPEEAPRGAGYDATRVARDGFVSNSSGQAVRCTGREARNAQLRWLSERADWFNYSIVSRTRFAFGRGPGASVQKKGKCLTSTASPTPSSSNPSPYQRKVMAVRDTVETAIADNTITIFSKTWCPYCKRAKALLTTKFPDVKTQILELDQLDEGDEIQNYLFEKTSQRSVPNIFINQKHVGGCDSVVGLDNAGKLQALVVA
ncbi:hypothetical protein NM688_g9118 [Phlebia brevispora]|uniref:Uncharacterized protein n=1 Tax=Phlebia brevispora TaxID=194682 RepID=A0ACC1RLW2_9APHY|nr:hypothetical protein NM688_g9118 [Phlebia brevispora]